MGLFRAIGKWVKKTAHTIGHGLRTINTKIGHGIGKAVHSVGKAASKVFHSVVSGAGKLLEKGQKFVTGTVGGIGKSLTLPLIAIAGIGIAALMLTRR